MASKIVLAVSEVVKPIAQSQDLELVDVEYIKKSDGMHLTITIAKEGGVTIDMCEKLHKAIDLPLDELDPTKGESYTLNVSSLGLDRQFKSTRDYERYLNKKIVIKLYSPQEKKKEYIGILLSVDDNNAVIDFNGNQISFERKKIAASQPYIEF